MFAVVFLAYFWFNAVILIAIINVHEKRKQKKNVFVLEMIRLIILSSNI